ncbi:MAG: rhodanese-like domain-containing protein [Candidatus Babeliales bacterium]
MNKFIVVATCALGVLLAGCFGPEKKDGASTQRAEGLVIVNVLEPKYHEDCAIKGSINVPFDNLMEYAEKNWDKEKTHIVLYCGNYACTSSGAGARQLKDRGYKNVWAYEGGTAEWQHKGAPIVGKCESGFLKNFEVPEGYAERMAHDADIIISFDDLQKKIAESATK